VRRVDDAGDRVGAVDGGGAVAQHFDAPYAGGGDRVCVDGGDGHQVLDLDRGVQHHAPAIEQHQRVAGADAAQVYGRSVAARVIDAAGEARFVERHITSLRDGAEEFVAACWRDGVDIVLAEHRDGQNICHLGAADLRADDDDVRLFLDERGLGRILGCGLAREQR
jgi:hypothetical protein